MDNIIKQVIETEYKAQKIVNELEKERKQAISNMERDILKAKEEIFSLSERKAKKIKTGKLEQARTEAYQIMSEARIKADKLQKKFESRRDIWAKDMMKAVIGQYNK